MAFEWIAESLDSEKFDLIFILLNPGPSPLEEFLKEKGIPVFRVLFRGKKDFFSAFFKLSRVLKQEKVALIHCHIFEASLLGTLVAKYLGIKKRIFTRHHATLHHVYYPRAVYYDHLVNYLATDIVAISENVAQILTEKEKVSEQKIHLIHHGFHLEDFQDISPPRIDALKEKYVPAEYYPVIGVIARQTEWKGIQYIIPAFQQLLGDYPNAYLILANAKGDYSAQIQAQLVDIPEKNYCQIPFEADIFALYQLFDVYVHCPVDAHSEAFGQTYVEALAAGIPSVFTLSGVAREFIRPGENALIVPFQNTPAIYEAILRLLKEPALRDTLIEMGRREVQARFPLQKMIEELEKLYQI